MADLIIAPRTLMRRQRLITNEFSIPKMYGKIHGRDQSREIEGRGVIAACIDFYELNSDIPQTVEIRLHQYSAPEDFNIIAPENPHDTPPNMRDSLPLVVEVAKILGGRFPEKVIDAFIWLAHDVPGWNTYYQGFDREKTFGHYFRQFAGQIELISL